MFVRYSTPLQATHAINRGSGSLFNAGTLLSVISLNENQAKQLNFNPNKQKLQEITQPEVISRVGELGSVYRYLYFLSIILSLYNLLI